MAIVGAQFLWPKNIAAYRPMLALSTSRSAATWVLYYIHQMDPMNLATSLSC